MKMTIGIRRAWGTLASRLAAVLALSALSLGAVACDDDDDSSPQEPTKTIVDIAAESDDFTILVAALEKANLVTTLQGKGPFTVFAPTDAAFAASGITSLDGISAEELQTILLYHVLPASVNAANVAAGPINTAANLTAFISTDAGVEFNGGNAQTGGATVTATDIAADNGFIHVIDRVLLPPDIADCASYANLTSLVGAIGAAANIPQGESVLETLKGEGPFTVFAPDNAAFDSIDVPNDADVVRDILLYHVIGDVVTADRIPAKADSLLTNRWGNGVTMLFDTSSGVRVNGASVVAADLRCTNGVVHVIDEVLLPPNVVDMAGIAGFFSLVGAVLAADNLPDGTTVAEALSADSPYTVFAPTNDAFANLGPVNDTQLLRDVLLLHVVEADVPVLSSGLPSSASSLLTGKSLSFDVSGPSVSSDGTTDANILTTDINVTNGVIHVLDSVLLL
jgi:transforming growth factor-beta-induced protein